MKAIRNLVLMSLISMTALAAEKAPKNVIGMEKATEIALQTCNGTIKSSEFEFENKMWVYSFDIQGSDSKIHEILLNAKDGKVISNKIETSKEEAAEKAADEKAKTN